VGGEAGMLEEVVVVGLGGGFGRALHRQTSIRWEFGGWGGGVWVGVLGGGGVVGGGGGGGVKWLD